MHFFAYNNGGGGNMNNIEIGKYIKKLRIEKNLKQADLAEKLSISIQAVSHWENGNTLPDTSILLDLADVLGTNVDLILSAGHFIPNKRNVIYFNDIKRGIDCIKEIRDTLGENSFFYKGMIEGINNKMNFNILEALDTNLEEVLYAEAIIQAIMFDQKTVNIEDIEYNFKNKKMVEYIKKYI